MSALTGVGEPGVERDLGGLRDRPAEQPERDENGKRARLAERLLGAAEDGCEVERARLLDQDEEREREGGVAERVHDERLLAGLDGLRAVVPEVDEEVRREADHPPPGQEEEQVSGLDEEEHREDEERLVGVVAPLLRVAAHVADRVGQDQEADARDDEHLEHGQRVDEDLDAEAEVPRGKPGPDGRRVRALLRVLAQEENERDDRGDERDKGRPGGDVTGDAWRDARTGERDQDDAHRGCDERDPGGLDHALIPGGR
jgi:hypothetical protein